MRSFMHISLGAASLLILSAGQVQAAANVPEAAVKMGEQLYNQNCSVFHQADAIGKPGFAPSLTNPELLSTASDKFLMSTIRDGRPGTGMMPFAHLGRKKIKAIVAYLQSRPEVTDVLFTGGDPLIMKTRVLRSYIEPLLRLDTLSSIRIGTKAPAYWPYRFTTDKDAQDLLNLFEEVRAAGKHLALMAHYSHPRELEPQPAREEHRIANGEPAARAQRGPLELHSEDQPGGRGTLSAFACLACLRHGSLLPHRPSRGRRTG